MFAGISVLTRLDGILPNAQETVLSQLAAHTFGRGAAYGYIQAATALILVLVANTAFSDFQRLLFFLGRDSFAPKMFLRMGDRLAHSNGIITLAVAAGALVIAFRAQTDSLISLYAVGVFLAFTLSQTGMIVRWWRRREDRWRRALSINAFGAVLSASVLVVVAVTKFTERAWVVVLLIPALIAPFRRIHAHYACTERARAPHPLPAEEAHRVLQVSPRPTYTGHAVEPERVEAPDEVENLIVVPVSNLDLPALRALAYAASLCQPVLALHVSPDEETAARIRRQWQAWGDHTRLEVIISPYRLVTLPLVNYLRSLRSRQTGLTGTVVMPEAVPAGWWQHVLHNQVSIKLALMLRREFGVVVTSVPFHLPPC